MLEGGGVKGLALAGALQPFGDAGYSFARVGGTSAGALVGAVLAALQQRGEPVSRIEDIARTLDFRRFPDRGFPGRYLGPLGFVADGLSVLLEDGAYEGRYVRLLAHRRARRPRGRHVRRPAHRRRRRRRHRPLPLPAGRDRSPTCPASGWSTCPGSTTSTASTPTSSGSWTPYARRPRSRTSSSRCR